MCDTGDQPSCERERQQRERESAHTATYAVKPYNSSSLDRHVPAPNSVVEKFDDAPVAIDSNSLSGFELPRRRYFELYILGRESQKRTFTTVTVRKDQLESPDSPEHQRRRRSNRE